MKSYELEPQSNDIYDIMCRLKAQKFPWKDISSNMEAIPQDTNHSSVVKIGQV